MTSVGCAHHDGAPRVAICSVCRKPICLDCHRATLTGYAVCTTCEDAVRESFKTRWETARSVGEHLHAFGWTAVAVLSRGRAFYAATPAFGPAIKPALFGVLCTGIGAFSGTVWQWAFVERFDDFLGQFATDLGIPLSWALPVMIVTLPFVAPMTFLLHLALFHLALRWVGAPTNWTASTRIVSYASAAYLFQVVPPVADFPVGHMLAIVWLVNVEMMAIRQYFRLGMWQSMLVVFVPFVFQILVGG